MNLHAVPSTNFIIRKCTVNDTIAIHSDYIVLLNTRGKQYNGRSLLAPRPFNRIPTADLWG